MKQHRWAKEIKAWADGAEIECKWLNGSENEKWFNPVSPDWDNKNYEFRIKPTPKEPQYLYVYKSLDGYTDCSLTKAVNTGWIYVGKIKLEQDDE
jgi:hypothetical protein